MTPVKAALLLNPADKQNVPKAVNLIQHLLDLPNEGEIPNNVLPSKKEWVKNVKFIGKVLSYFLLPFIKVEMLLSKQLQDLSTYSHLITALYKRHGLEFMTSALLADSQAIVKNIIFTTAHLQILDSNVAYFILFEGTDHLENLFSHVRTQDHARNFDILQLSQKLSIGAEVDAIFQHHPDLNRGHVRHNLINACGVDHMNPKSWVGNVCIGDVNIKEEYLAGREKANALLVTHFGPGAAINFDKVFSDENVDHLWPNSEYVGSCAVDNDEENDDIDVIAEEDKVENEDEGENPTEDTRDSIDHDQFNGLDFEHKDLLNPSPKKPEAHYLEINGEKQYIPTVINNLLGADREKQALVTTWPL